MAIQTQKITQLLNEAEKATCAPWKFDKYYEAAKLQVRAGLKGEAKDTFDLARKHSDDKIVTLCKLAKISIMINPRVIPKELLRAEEVVYGNCQWAEKQPLGRVTLGSVYADQLAIIGKRYFQLQKKSKGNSILKKALEWAGHEGRMIETMHSYYKIAKIHHAEKNQQEFLEIIKRMEGFIPYLSESSISFGFAIKIAGLFLTIDKERGQRFISLAEKELQKIGNNDSEKRTLESVIEGYCASEKIEIQTVIRALARGYSNAVILAFYEKCKNGIESSKKEKTDELVYHLLYERRYPDDTVKMVLEQIHKIPSRHLYETIEKGFSDDIVLMVLDRVEKRKDILNIEGIGKKLSPVVAEKLIAKKFAEKDRDSLFAVDVALETKCSEHFVLNLLSQVPTVGLSALHTALEKRYSEAVVHVLVNKQETKQELSYIATIAEKYGYSKEMIQFLNDVNKENCIVM
ncbi:MAG: hypothetical protein WA678_05970 [Rhabdochlamydiaceae bacterium]|jgi:hypothetical protein